MWNLRLVVALLAFRLLTAQPAPETGPSPALLAASRAPVLRPGEGFAITLGDGEVRAFGEARKEAPMGSLAKLVWMRLEGAEWSSSGVQYRCKGTDGPFVCWNREGHGRVDLGRALQESCNLAFLVWIAGSRERWLQDYGPDAARARLEDVFQPFLGRRLPLGEGLPPLTAAWVGDGDLLRTSPEAFLRWLMEPDQAEVVTFGKRFLAGYWVEFMDLFGKEGWWFKTGTGPVPGEPTATSAWVAGGRGSALVVLHLPRGRGKQEGMVRIREILGLKP
ncbi:hypothetical protein [Geothrix edaphica]|uniref:Penicillin-binding protein transpeptidase domain-containing protein n=1 Tax=Geothrix edaphica TaxID=2927976 RepID=A0ABQ5PWG0_9BACT|nr:hypothetical protein [Geothrix edaphica]GLH66465.1 hypothetical protein GETHED_08290 [Geothrix edaphica]